MIFLFTKVRELGFLEATISLQPVGSREGDEDQGEGTKRESYCIF
jgi:hypothetical protein